MTTPTRATGGSWMSGSSSMRLSASIPGLEDDPRWRPTTTCPRSTSNEQYLIKDGLPASLSFSKAVLDEEWYIASDNSLIDEIKELSYASSLASQADNVSSAHFNLDSPHLQAFLSRNVCSRPPFNTMDSRSNLSTFFDGALPFVDGTGSTSMSNFGQSDSGGLSANVMLDTHNCSANNSNSSSGGGILVHSNQAHGGCNSGGLLSNLSPRSSNLGDRFSQSLDGNFSSILNNGINNSFASCVNSHSSPFAIGNGGFGGDGFSNSLSRNLMGVRGRNDDNNSNFPLLNAERPPFRSKKSVASGAGGASMGSQQQQPQTLFQKRAALRLSVSGGAISPTIKAPPRVVTSASNDSSVDMPDEESPNNKSIILPGDPMPAQTPAGSDELSEFGLDGEQQRTDPDFEGKDEDDMDESGDGSGVLYETDDTLGMEGAGREGMGRGGGMSGEKGKGKKGLPAKNLMAERRRRKKLNDRLYMLRSVVPKITKMDRASILGDAIEYLKELLQRINDLHTELETTPTERPLPSSPQVLPPTTPSLPCRVKEETPSSLPSPDSQPARVEVRTREGRALNIHMFCQRKPGLLLSTMRALDGLGLDVQQAVISCFNGFALDVFKAEQSKDTEVGPEEIRSVLLHTVGSNLSRL